MKKILVVGDSSDVVWVEMLKDALLPLGRLDLVLGDDVKTKLEQHSYDLIIVDAGGSKNPIGLVSSIHKQKPDATIVVATISPTWRRAREFILAGATDYVRKSTDKIVIFDIFKAILITKKE